MQKSFVHDMILICRNKALQFERSFERCQKKRRDNKGRILRTGESQRADGRYMYKIC